MLYFTDNEEAECIVAKEESFEDLFDEYFLPTGACGKEDGLIQKEIRYILVLLDKIGRRPAIK